MSACYNAYNADAAACFEFDEDDDNASFDSGYEKSFETEAGTSSRRRLDFDSVATSPAPSHNAALSEPYVSSWEALQATTSPPGFVGLLDTSSNHSTRSGRTLLEHLNSKAKSSSAFDPQLTSTPMKSPDDQETPRPKRKYAVGKNRVTRSRSPLQVVRIKKFRRMKANDRERNRMHTLNDALERLRVTLPSLPEETKLTKIEILRFAHNYIFSLVQVLESGGTINLDLEKLQNFTLSGERITKELFDALFVNPQPYPMFGCGRLNFPYHQPQPPQQGQPHMHYQPQSMEYQQHQHQHQPSPVVGPHQHPPGFDFANSMRFYQQQQQRSHPETPSSMSGGSHFSQQKYDLYRNSFEIVANLTPGVDQVSGPEGSVPLHQHSSFYTQTPPWKEYNEEPHHSYKPYTTHPHQV